MKNLLSAVLCVSVTLTSLCGMAQTDKVPVNEPDYNKPKLFTAFPEKINVDVNRLNDLLTTNTGSSVDVKISEILPFNGQVVSMATSDDKKVSSVVIRSANFPGARLTLSKINLDGKTIYAGRILSMQHGDLYELQLLNGQYSFIKKNLYDLVNE